ncbi:helix-turn-helix domain-containing protein [Mycolicibacterium sp.]|uniref:helix-turn-helix domain-containing protein n=1 Tax=Mycolicibacterium sp. TaxID=2320850 RepID=UPI0037CC044F
MQANPELDQLLQDRFGIPTSEFVAALKVLPALRPWAASLTEGEARILDSADFPEDRDAFLAAGTDIAGHVAHLAVTAFTTEEVAAGLGVSASRVRQKRLAGELWAIPDGQGWLFPMMQFETADNGRPKRQIRGLDEVLRALPTGLHPAAIAGFLRTPQPDLYHHRPMTPVEWLRDGGDIAQAVTAATSADWYTT